MCFAVSGSIRQSTDEPRILANGNSVQRIQVEAAEIGALLQMQKDHHEKRREPPKIVVRGSDEDFFITVIVENEHLSEEELTPFFAQIFRFVHFRSIGHTRAYAAYMALHKQTVCPESLRAKLPGIENYSAHVAYPWIEPTVEWCVAYPTARNGQAAKVAFIVDGDLAWLYEIKAEGVKSGAVAGHCLDGIELHPGLAPLFRSLYEDLTVRDVAPVAGRPRSPDWWIELRRILLEKHRIKWRTPTELNPGTRFE